MIASETGISSEKIEKGQMSGTNVFEVILKEC